MTIRRPLAGLLVALGLLGAACSSEASVEDTDDGVQLEGDVDTKSGDE